MSDALPLLTDGSGDGVRSSGGAGAGGTDNQHVLQLKRAAACVVCALKGRRPRSHMVSLGGGTSRYSAQQVSTIGATAALLPSQIPTDPQTIRMLRFCSPQ